jgi:AraC-like DNA-binding protein
MKEIGVDMLVNKSIFSDVNGNALRLSCVYQADQKVDFQHFSAKFVVSGSEHYRINSKKITVNKGEYVIGNSTTDSKVFIDDTKLVQGICMDISKEYLSEVIQMRFEESNDFNNFLFEQDWMVQKYNINSTSLGYVLRQLSVDFENLSTGFSHVNKELFYALAECIVSDQSFVFKSFNKLTAKKIETNGRLFNFVYDAKYYIDNHFLDNINIDSISREAKLSEYHFIRLFKLVFNTTPYKYSIEKKLEFGRELLQNNYSTSEVSSILGYTDMPAFSKAFKQKFGFSPSRST